MLTTIPNRWPLRVVHIRKNLKFSISQKWLTILIKFCGFIVHSNLNNMILSAIPGKIPETKKNFFFYQSPNLAIKPTNQSCSNSIFRVLLQVYPASTFHFRPSLNIMGTLMFRIVHIRNGVTNMEFYKHHQLFLLLCYEISRRDRQESIVISHLKSNAYRNKSLSN